MDAYTHGRFAPSVPLSAGTENPVTSAPNVFDKLEGLVHAARQMEAALAAERNRTQQLQDQLRQAHAHFDKIVKDSEAKNNELSAKDRRLEAAIAEYHENEKRLSAKLNALSAEFTKSQAELRQYRAAWSEVLQREREAKLIIREGEKIHQQLAETQAQNKTLVETLASEKAQREQIERHSKSYQLELQNTLVRLHSAEAKFNELSREYTLSSQSRKNLQEEVAKVEQSIRERYQWELVKEREKMRAEAQRQIALEREQLREQGRGSELFRNEVQREIARVRGELASKVRQELGPRLRSETLAEAERKLNEEREGFNRFREEAEVRVVALRKELTKQREEAEEARRAADEQVSGAQGEVRRLEERLREFESQMTSARESTLLLRGELRKADDLDSKVQELETRLNEQASRVEEAEKRRAQAASRCEELDRQISEERRRRIEVESRLQEAEKARAEQVVAAAAAPPLPNIAVDQGSVAKAIEEVQSYRERVLELEARIAEEQRKVREAESAAERKIDAVILAERKRASEMVAQMRMPGGFMRRLRPSFLVSKDNASAEYHARNFEYAFQAELNRSSGLESALIAEKARFDEMANRLEAEVQRLRTVYPLKDLISVKDAEIKRVEMELSDVSKRKAAKLLEKRLRQLRDERSKLAEMIESHEKRVAEQIDRIEKARASNTHLAEAAGEGAEEVLQMTDSVALDLVDDLPSHEC